MSNPQDRQSLLRPSGSDLSDVSASVTSPPLAVSQQQRGYKRKPVSDELIPSLSQLEQEESLHSYQDDARRRNEGLGITGANRPISIARKPVGAGGSPQTPIDAANSFQQAKETSPGAKSSPNTPDIATPNSGNGLLSPPWDRRQSDRYSYGDGEEGDLSGRAGHRRTVSFPDDAATPYIADDETAQLKHATSSTFSKEPMRAGCATKHDIESGRGSWLSITLIGLSFYSTTMAILWLVTAAVQPRWGRSIYTGGTLTPSTASLLTALFAKSIELSFVTVFVGFLGQVLSRRSVAKYSKGVTIAEMSMRTWVIQPGFMLTHWQTLRYVGWTFLGVLSFTAAVGAMLYTTASDALVSPKLKFGDWTNIPMQGLVRTSYANPEFISSSCQTPITVDEDGVNAGLTCMAIENAGQSYYNFLSWMAEWAKINQNGTGASTNILERPLAAAILYDNTTVQGSWVMANQSNMTLNNEKYSRIVNNVTMAMPHANLYAAARDPTNSIMQPSELDGVGGYSVRASVVSPAVNVLCVNMDKDELAPLVYTEWKYANLTNSTQMPSQMVPANSEGWVNDIPTVGSNGTWLNATVVDEIFQWGEKYKRRPPVFQMLPADWNTIMNKSMYQADSVYFLVKREDITNYTLCSLRSFLYPNCSTQLDVSGTSGGSLLQSHCEDPQDREAYSLSVPDSPISHSTDWVNYAVTWGLAISLNDGSVDANSSTARLLSQFVLANDWQPELSSLQPSLAEAVAVLVGSTLLISTLQASFFHYWQYDSPTLDPGDYETFNASISTQQYTSGYAQAWQAAFYPILVIVALINLFCFVYFYLHSGLLTDFTEPQNLFALAVNSPPSENLAGSCGAGPERAQFQTDWFIRHEDETNHYYIQEGEAWKRKSIGTASGYEMSPNSPGQTGTRHVRGSSYSRLSHSRSFL